MRSLGGSWAWALGAVLGATGCQTEVLNLIASPDAGASHVNVGASGVDAGSVVELPDVGAPWPDADAEAPNGSGFVDAWSPMGGGPRPSHCGDGPRPGATSCSRQEGEACTSSAECCVGACLYGSDGTRRCRKSLACGVECETCASDRDCCAGHCNDRKGDPKRCEAAR